MVAKQVIFKELLTGDGLTIGGIAIYEDYEQGTDCPFLKLQGVICGECGVYLEAEDCKIVKVLDTWWNIDEAIKDNIYPDGTRGFRT